MKKFPFPHIDRRALATFFGISVLTFLAKMTIVGKELVVAARYGRQDEVDAFLIAFLVPSFIVSILGNAMTTAVIPVYVQVREREGREAARQLMAGLSFLTLFVVLAFAVLVFLAMPFFLPLIGSGFSGSKLLLTRHMLCWVTPYIVLSGFLSLWYAILNAQEKFAAVVLPPAITPIVMILLLLCFPAAGIYALVYGVLAGAVIELAVAGGILRAGGISLRLRWSGLSPRLRQVIGQFIPATGGSLLQSSTLLVDQAMAAMLAAGSVAAISYGNKVIGFSLTILATTFTTLLTPYFSKRVAGGLGMQEGAVAVAADGAVEVDGVVAGDGPAAAMKGGIGRGALKKGALKRGVLRPGTLKRGTLKPLWQFTLLVFVVTAVLPVLINLFSVPIVKLIFYRGAFSLTDVKLTAGVQALLAWQIPFYICGVILVKFIAALQLNWIQVVVAAVNVVVNIGMNYWLMQRMGVYGIALSTSIVHMVSLLLLIGLIWFSVGRAKKYNR